MPLPTLTEEQRKEALAKAAEARRKRAEIKEQLKSGKLKLKDVLEPGRRHRRQDEGLHGPRVAPGVGKVRARKIMEQLDISATRRVRGLGAKQRDALLDEFAGR